MFDIVFAKIKINLCIVCNVVYNIYVSELKTCTKGQ
jgi:hypothetical protein